MPLPRPSPRLAARQRRESARSRGAATRRARSGRVLVALLVTAVLGVGGYLVGRTMTDPPADRHAGATAPATSYAGDPTPIGSATSPTHSPRTSPTDDGTPQTRDPGRTSPTADPSAPPSSMTPAAPPGPSGAAGSPGGAPPGPSTGTSPATGAAPSTGTASSSPARDTAPPRTSLSEEFPAPDAAVFTLRANEPATFACSVDGAAYESCGAVLRLTDLTAGWHTLAVRATDAAGNTDPTPAETTWHAAKGGPT